MLFHPFLTEWMYQTKKGNAVISTFFLVWPQNSWVDGDVIGVSLFFSFYQSTTSHPQEKKKISIQNRILIPFSISPWWYRGLVWWQTRGKAVYNKRRYSRKKVHSSFNSSKVSQGKEFYFWLQFTCILLYNLMHLFFPILISRSTTKKVPWKLLCRGGFSKVEKYICIRGER